MHSSVVFAARCRPHFVTLQSREWRPLLPSFCCSVAAACSSSQPQLHAITGSSPTGATDVSAKHECMQVPLVIQSMQWKSIFISERTTRFWVVNNHSLTTCVRTYSNVNIIYTLCTSDKNCVSCLCSEYQVDKRCMVLLPEMGGPTSTITTANAYTNTTCSWDSRLRLNNGVRVSAHFMFMICIQCVNILHIFTYAASVYQNQLAGGGKYSIIL